MRGGGVEGPRGIPHTFALLKPDSLLNLLRDARPKEYNGSLAEISRVVSPRGIVIPRTHVTLTQSPPDPQTNSKKKTRRDTDAEHTRANPFVAFSRLFIPARGGYNWRLRDGFLRRGNNCWPPPAESSDRAPRCKSSRLTRREKRAERDPRVGKGEEGG